MKESLDLNFQPDLSGRPASHRDWTWRSVFRVVLAVAMLIGVCLLATRIPVSPLEVSLDVLGEFIVYWGVGGLVTVILLIISDRVARGS